MWVSGLQGKREKFDVELRFRIRDEDSVFIRGLVRF